MTRPMGPTWHDRRAVESGVPTIMITLLEAGGPVTCVGAGAATPLWPELLAAANLAVRNPSDAAALELHGPLTLALHGSALGVGLDDVGLITMAPGNQLRINEAPGRFRYLTVAGGVHLGWLRSHGQGDQLSAGTVLLPADALGVLTRIPAHVSRGSDAAVRVRRVGDGGALAQLCEAPLAVGQATRQRLELVRRGDPGRDLAAAAPRLPPTTGHVVVDASGALAVIGPDHPVGPPVPVLGEILRADLGRLYLRRAGAPVRFTEAS